jgi:hypothetical protein
VSVDVREPADIELRTEPAIRVSLRAADETVPAGWGAELVVEASATYQVSDALAANLKTQPPIDAPNPQDVWDESNRELGASLWHWTSGKRELEPISRQLTDSLLRSVLVLRWRMGLGGSHYPFNPAGLYWAVPAETPRWTPIPMPGTVMASDEVVPRITPEIGQQVVGLIAMGVEEPLAHAMWREAWTQRASNPRSALVVGVAAAEVGLKRCVAALAPITQWLLEETQAPQIAKMLKNYLPQLTDRAKNTPVPAELRKVLDNMATARNHLVHRGDMERGWRQLESDLIAVKDLLYLLDYYEGQDWALERLSPPVADATHPGH